VIPHHESLPGEQAEALEKLGLGRLDESPDEGGLPVGDGRVEGNLVLIEIGGLFEVDFVEVGEEMYSFFGDFWPGSGAK
jgi:hypothetical protein